MRHSPPIIFDLGGDVSTGDLVKALLFFDVIDTNKNNAKLYPYFKKLAVARIHEKVRNGRLDLHHLDLHHKITHKLICENQATSHVIEYLGVKNMVKNHKKQALADVAGLATV